MNEEQKLRIKRAKLVEDYVGTLKQILEIDSQLKIIEAEKLVKGEE